ncbi:hypothetical protein HHK36_001952 [Tetracentron sinense]|uniref:Uncharacterized protein n=1 Tax=Tetracentron sinense TaxID=13715 RepID=A0A834ZY70_TETSI|nr:hypothetical protein HHK36_001952 [Tetracentron sinense]
MHLQGDRTKKVGIIDSEFIVHQGIQTLGGSSARKRHGVAAVDVRSEIRRQSTSELQIFRTRWDQAVREDKDWVDPYKRNQRHQKLLSII